MRQTEETRPLQPRNVPISITKDHSKDGFLSSDEDAKYEKFSSELSKRYVGPMPPRKLILALSPVVPPPDDKMPLDHTKLKDMFQKDTTSNHGCIKYKMCKYFNSSGICPNFKLVEPPESTNSSTLSRPDLCLFREDVLENTIESDTQILGGAELFVQYRSSDAREDPFKDPVPGTGIPGFNFIRDIYEELEEEEEEEETEIDDTYTRNRGEITAYAAELCARQFRTHCFSVSIYGTKVRLFRWDRAGVVISEAFDILENPELLCQFMWNYTHASAAQRGFDTSVTKASKIEEDIFAKFVRSHIKEQLSVEDTELDRLVNEHYEPNSVFKIPILPRRMRKVETSETNTNSTQSVEQSIAQPWDDLWREVCNTSGESASDVLENGSTTNAPSMLSKSRAYPKTQYFLVSRPVASPLKMFCRGTRGYWAVKLPDKRIGETEPLIAFVKDTWREAHDDTDIEGEVIIDNVESGVKFVPDIFCHGDVRVTDKKSNCDDPKKKTVQTSRTGKYAHAKWNCTSNESKERASLLKHYRIASVEVGYPLSSFKGTKELVHGVRCGFLAAWAACVLCRRLHRDISLNNIILVNKGGRWRTGFLIDWEMSSIVGKDGKARDNAKTGTWAFMSIALLRAKTFKHRFQDDMESFFYVLLYASVLWLPRKEERNFQKLMSNYFDEYRDWGGKPEGGCIKLANIGGRYFQDAWHFHNVHIQSCLDGLIELQRPFKEQPDWTPQAFYAILESADKEDLPLDDRMDHYQIKRDKIAQRRAWIEEQYETDSPSVQSVSGLSTSAQTVSDDPEAHSKRNVNDADLDEPVEPANKRLCYPVPNESLQEQGVVKTHGCR